MHDLCHRDIRKYHCRDGTVTVFTKRGNASNASVSTLVSSALAAQLAGFIVDTEPSAARIQHIADRLTPAEKIIGESLTDDPRDGVVVVTRPYETTAGFS
ncbi:hypothetical protein ACJMK2_038506 [Sinanodonta woodiana]|uniref:Uncharacterized protein n=1 Tax=Sinanodonta woodiana TaxID=1069815 RepID=A0ABD3WB34_SINWO